ncbi:radical SAM protein [Fibrobacter sp. UWB7]|uniref:7-carboxy-7-deazaguanine synthase QueE n=1 Tax=Fibrobacter sp. UWB7 TaxID=1896206 RepID=UPI00091D8880|nr:radical SAM protein [Fibrobacter sp. UWB7]SHM47018.1 7-carboxy-7-deazaguanine synthase [Fibrobacter sp. UWB7]
MKVCEIFKSIEGEGIRMGQSAVFVRLHGCNLRCSYCDSMYAVEGPDFKLMSVGEVLAAVEAYRNESGVKCVTLTGGEPLIHENVGELLTAFCEAGFEVNIETNGTVPCKWQLPGLFYTMDWKCKSSGMSARMKMENIISLGKNDVLKFVVGSVEDLLEAEGVVARLSLTSPDNMPHIFISPVWGELTNEQIVNWMVGCKVMTQNNARFQVQLHKIVWDPDMRGV